jgi:hypothetical protein
MVIPQYIIKVGLSFSLLNNFSLSEVHDMKIENIISKKTKGFILYFIQNCSIKKEQNSKIYSFTLRFLHNYYILNKNKCFTIIANEIKQSIKMKAHIL